MNPRQDRAQSERRKQQQRVEEPARRLAAAAVELIVEKGYAHTTAKDISLRAGYSRAMVAERFGSKEALLDALMNQYEGRIVADADGETTGFER
jgi:AcrR family transcriptional regulator